MIGKVCPVVIREPDILVFRHPLAGVQLVKGTIEPGERPEAAALRELHEESGIRGRIKRAWPSSTEIVGEENWHFFEIETGSLPDRWSHQTQDGGGLTFEFFWRSLRDRAEMDRRFVNALAWIEAHRS